MLAIGLFSGKLFLIQMLVNKLKKLYQVRKLKKPTHLPLVFNKAIVSQINSQEHLGVTLDSTLTFEEHLLNVFEKVDRTIGRENVLPSYRMYYQE